MAENKDKSRYYLWFDTEFTSLDLEKSRLLQVALIVTDYRLRRLVPPEQDFNCYVRIGSRAKLSAWHREHLAHVLECCRSAEAVSVPEINRRLGKYIDRVLGPISPEVKRRPMLAGNSLYGDVYLAHKFLPELMRRVHYRLVDVTSIKVQWLQWFRGRLFEKESPAWIRKYFKETRLVEKGKVHDAYYDVTASIAELAYYRSQLVRSKHRSN